MGHEVPIEYPSAPSYGDCDDCCNTITHVFMNLDGGDFVELTKITGRYWQGYGLGRFWDFYWCVHTTPIKSIQLYTELWPSHGDPRSAIIYTEECIAAGTAGGIGFYAEV